MSVKLGKMEVTLNGTLENVGPTLVAIGASFGYPVWEQSVPRSGPAYKSYEVDYQEPGSTPVALGVIVIEQITHQDVLMTFGPVSDWLGVEAVKTEYVEKFWDFMDAALRQLVALGYGNLAGKRPQRFDPITPHTRFRQ